QTYSANLHRLSGPEVSPSHDGFHHVLTLQCGNLKRHLKRARGCWHIRIEEERTRRRVIVPKQSFPRARLEQTQAVTGFKIFGESITGVTVRYSKLQCEPFARKIQIVEIIIDEVEEIPDLLIRSGFVGGVRVAKPVIDTRELFTVSSKRLVTRN